MWWVIIIIVFTIMLVWSIKRNKKKLKIASIIILPLSVILWSVVLVECIKLDSTSYSSESERASYQLIYTLSMGKELEIDDNNRLHTQDYYYYTSRDVGKLEQYEIIDNKVKKENVKLRMISDSMVTPCVEVYIRKHEPLLSKDEWFWLTLFGASDNSLDNYIIDHYEIFVTQDILDNDMIYRESDEYQ